jgi:HSP20 family protein
MSKNKGTVGSGMVVGGLFGSLGKLIEQLGELAEKGEELKRAGEFSVGQDGKAVYGFTIRSGSNKSGEAGGIKIEPLGNVKPDKKTGKPVVESVIEPPADVFEETDHLLVLVELPGAGSDDVEVTLDGRMLTVTAETDKKKYRKEIELPVAPLADRLSHTCLHGVLEVKLPL